MPHKVLIADDSELLRNQLMKDLENGGFQVLAAANGGEGILLAKENPDVAVIIADFNMPDIDGLTMIESDSTKCEEKRISPHWCCQLNHLSTLSNVDAWLEFVLG